MEEGEGLDTRLTLSEPRPSLFLRSPLLHTHTQNVIVCGRTPIPRMLGSRCGLPTNCSGNTGWLVSDAIATIFCRWIIRSAAEFP